MSILLPHWGNLCYILRHKWFVLLEGRKIGTPLRCLILHDLSKFRASEWGPYVDFFYRNGGAKQCKDGGQYTTDMGPTKFNIAWLKHQHRNPHHWQHWVLREDDGQTTALPMPRRFVYEMVADWMGMSRAFKTAGVGWWYRQNKHKILLHPDTQSLVETILQRIEL